MDPIVDAFGAAGAEYRFIGKRRAAEGTFLFHNKSPSLVKVYHKELNMERSKKLKLYKFLKSCDNNF